MLSDAEKNIKKKSKELVRLEECLADLEKIIEDEKEVERLALELRPVEMEIKRIKEYEKELKDTKVKYDEATGVEKEFMELEKELSSLEAAKKMVDFALNELKAEKKRLVSLTEGFERSLVNASKLLGKPIKDSSGFKEEVERLLSKLKREVQEKRGHLEKATRLLGEKNAALDSIRKAALELSKAEGICPLCERELTPSHREELQGKFKAEESTLSASIERLVSEIKTHKGAILTLERRIESLSVLNPAELREREAQVKEMEKRIDRATNSLKKDSVELDGITPLLEKKSGLEKKLGGLRSFKDRHTEALGFLRKNMPLFEELAKKESMLGKQIERKKGELGMRVKELGIDIKSLSTNIEEAKGRRSVAQKELVTFEKEAASLETKREERRKRISELEEEIKIKEELVFELESLLEFKKFLEKLRSLFHKDALQRELRIRARPLIEDYTRNIFLSFNLPYTDVTLTDDFSLVVHGEKGEETVDMLSGGERIAAALALRIGLSRAISGPVMELIILDEPTIHLDAQRRRELVEVVRKLATIPQTIVVTHDKEFEESADTIIEVEKVNGISMVS